MPHQQVMQTTTTTTTTTQTLLSPRPDTFIPTASEYNAALAVLSDLSMSQACGLLLSDADLNQTEENEMKSTDKNKLLSLFRRCKSAANIIENFQPKLRKGVTKYAGTLPKSPSLPSVAKSPSGQKLKQAARKQSKVKGEHGNKRARAPAGPKAAKAPPPSALNFLAALNAQNAANAASDVASAAPATAESVPAVMLPPVAAPIFPPDPATTLPPVPETTFPPEPVYILPPEPASTVEAPPPVLTTESTVDTATEVIPEIDSPDEEQSDPPPKKRRRVSKILPDVIPPPVSPKPASRATSPTPSTPTSQGRPKRALPKIPILQGHDPSVLFLVGEEVLVRADGSKFRAIIRDYDGLYTVEFEDGEVREGIHPIDVLELDD